MTNYGVLSGGGAGPPRLMPVLQNGIRFVVTMINKNMTQTFTGVYSQKIENKQFSIFSLKTLNCLLAGLIVASSLYFVSGINDLVVKGFKIQELKTQANSLSEEKNKVNIEITSLKSYNNLAKRIENLKMVAVDNVDYLKINSGVAVAR
jgi:hypothetical protein